MPTLTPDETLLGLIALQACHGYELVDAFRRSADLAAIWKMSTSQIYAVLKRLESQQLITGRVLASDTAPSRREYQLTAAGQSRLMAWLYEPAPSASIRRVRVEFLSRLYIARRLNVPTTAIVQHQRAACQAARHELAAELHARPSGMAYLAHEFVIAQLDAVLAWIERCELVPRELEE